MTSARNGWVIINIGHPRTGNEFIVNDTFAFTRRAAVKNFVAGSGGTWLYWRNKFNYRVVRANQTIIISNDH